VLELVVPGPNGQCERSNKKNHAGSFIIFSRRQAVLIKKKERTSSERPAGQLGRNGACGQGNRSVKRGPIHKPQPRRGMIGE
jgi:hypothetical protein